MPRREISKIIKIIEISLRGIYKIIIIKLIEDFVGQ